MAIVSMKGFSFAQGGGNGNQGGTSDVDIRQTTGESTTAVMSQKAVSDALIDAVHVDYFPSPQGGFPNINTSTKCLEFSGDVGFFVKNAAVAMQNFSVNDKNISFNIIDDTSLLRLVVNLNSKKLYFKANNSALQAGEYTLGFLRRNYITHNFTAAQFNFNYTVNGEAPQFGGVGKAYTGERISINQKFAQSSVSFASLSGSVPAKLETQGMDIYGDTMFIGNGTISDGTEANVMIVDMVKRKVLATINLGQSHANNINCGNFFASGDTYPTLYISATYYDHRCDVYRITGSTGERVQVIKYAGTRFANSTAYDWFVDVNTDSIYAFGNKTNNHDDGQLILKFPQRSLDVAEVVYNDADILDTYELSIGVYQGSRVINGKLFLTSGLSTTASPSRLYVFDFDRRKIVSMVELGAGEPESCAPYDGKLWICPNVGSISRLNFKMLRFD